jgi:ribosome maturation factor RimP
LGGFFQPIFFGRTLFCSSSILGQLLAVAGNGSGKARQLLDERSLSTIAMSWQSAVERTVTGLGYDLVDAEKSAGGLLRVLIDHLAPAGAFITVDDCEKVTRQLQHVLEVEGASYERLEVSSPGLDRPLKKAADYARFVGEQIELTLKLPFKGRKKYRGELQSLGDGWRLLLPSERVVAKGAKKPSIAPAAATTRAADAADIQTDSALDFSLDEVREAHLVPVVDFKGRRFAAPGIGAVGAEFQDDEIDGGRIQ